MSRGYAKGRARRREILLAALNAFAEQGFRATSMREIAEMVGLSQAGLLHHFSSKNELLEEVLRLRDEEQRAFNERFGRRDGLNAVRYLIDLVELNARQVELVRLYTVLAGESVGAGHPARPYFLERYATVRERVADRLRDARDCGDIRADVDLQDVASVLIAVMDGLQIQWLHDPEAVDMKTAFADFLGSYLRGLAPETRE
ncbi:TetR/AcrR family transcriptional regulator [Actinomadura madurae]|uniref:TetR/AcrR family transcriptional regulator n=1 Tax=Actinomadura madurae TaxID=1993 RepID=UPI00202603CD|nr:TetR/AcrR family transcriptional regulator [Actinomadura madurae]MCP9949958.1 TetR/AcrR family transcriptional regulator [Actinomadura madurae]MCP9966715.1 TetR/AcrR family transcriptional regulator [Actinomadura madurae]MCQ0009270.1 TetR/AcrR family transcriptional regulator [Actinomadura madurae]MCQ0015394.1 TetR/AcrR family transcriptional regulator [Actinomadura madurae]URN06223.1 TetR/AcrR family transcriptional regulator [Actinomadura madurae]